LVTQVSGGAFGQLFSILEFDALNDLGDLVRTIRGSPLLVGGLAQLEDHGQRRHAAEVPGD
jgi:hypothetical protein